MTLSKAKAQAYQQLEDAIEAIVKAHDGPHVKPGWITNGWLLITTEVRVLSDDEMTEDDDEVDMKTFSGVYSRRGQSPLLSYGLAHEYIRHYDKVQGE